LENSLLYLFFTSVTAFVLSVAIIPQILKVVSSRNIFDTPGGRKIHKNSTPSMGGIGIFFSFIAVSMFLVKETADFNSQYFYLSLILLFFTGLRDDLLPLNSKRKFGMQFLAAIFTCGFANIRLNSMYSLAFLYEGPFQEWFSFFLTIVVLIILTNSFNLIDGIDGLASSIACIVCGALCTWFTINGFWAFAILCGTMLGAIIGFMYYNWSPARIFMGDTGSLIVGFFCIAMLIVFMNLNQEANVYQIENSGAFFFSILIYPIFDVLRVIALRLKRKKSPFSPDKLHVHLILKRVGFTHGQITCLIAFLSLVALGLFFTLEYYNIPELMIIPIIYLYALSLSILLKKMVLKFKKEKKPVELDFSQEELIAQIKTYLW